jgi:hypothetical protein
VSPEEEDESVVPKEVIRMAERLAKEGKVEGLRLLVRMALLPLQAQGALLWTERGKNLPGHLKDATPVEVKGPPHCLENAIPAEVLRALAELGAKALVRDGESPVFLDLGRHPAVSFPWNPDRVAWTLARIGEQEWKYDPVNHRAHFYRPLGVGFFCGGMHSGMAGILKGEGRLPATEVDLTPLYAAGLRVEWRELSRGEEKPFAVVGELARPMEHPHHALLLALGEVLHRHGVSL